MKSKLQSEEENIIIEAVRNNLDNKELRKKHYYTATVVQTEDNKPFYSCVLSCLAFEWKWGWNWPWFDRNLPTFFMPANDAVLKLISRNLHKNS